MTFLSATSWRQKMSPNTMIALSVATLILSSISMGMHFNRHLLDCNFAPLLGVLLGIAGIRAGLVKKKSWS